MSLVGSTMDPWQIEATLVNTSDSDARATLLGSTTASFTTGWANFSDLAISHSGTYRLTFTVSYPTEASHFTVDYGPFVVDVRPLSGQVTSPPNDTYPSVPFEMEIEVTDAVTGLRVEDIDWKVV